MAELDAVALLKTDHRKVEGLFEQFEKARGADKRKPLAQEICTELTVHTMIEEEIFYPACRGEIKDETVNEAYVEHDGAGSFVRASLALDKAEGKGGLRQTRCRPEDKRTRSAWMTRLQRQALRLSSL